ncbi:maleylpyruvate isomerase family mycothiol-dependent enzyme [Arthrobacter sp. NIO-1057]|uniref:maleylpyruvate isomerase family mycothiol-dependent enzyme n=1 Tax=Arthrobacter sp. NIO-1057 TaxID=993071 RepID=UPI00071DDEBB|nr:maleylpyruvate isomerase family mycothiol-dependent enzyme [Arthrobacter sp. NIO-1057]KSU66125.1 mycothiol-dependent maleylpyruvate isomerase [Arthrobacter sp. NIO-1057]SCC32718.1 maleylpyruvate isomerase [Arthrobacter sp. NIO-1057]
MINTARLHSDLSRLTRETASMSATVRTLSAEELSADSLCEGWSHAHVIAHLASNGRTLVKLVDWVTSGEPQKLYASQETRNAEIDELAALPSEELLAAFEESASYFAQECERLTGKLAVEEVDLHGKIIPAASIVALRTAEVVIHHHDLNTVWTIAEAEPDSQEEALEAAVRTMRFKDAPGMTLLANDGGEWVIGDGSLTVRADRAHLIDWLARGNSKNIEADGPIPELPTW